MVFETTKDEQRKQLVLQAIKMNNGYCPCQIQRNEDTVCICKHFNEEVKPDEYCVCGLYKKLKD